MNRVLSAMDLPMAQFVLLTHMSHNPKKGWTVTRLAHALEVNQPAMTKTTQRALKKGFLRVEADRSDKRVKVFYLTSDGIRLLGRAWETLLPDLAMLRDAWEQGELDDFQNLLERLKNQLDDARD